MNNGNNLSRFRRTALGSCNTAWRVKTPILYGGLRPRCAILDALLYRGYTQPTMIQRGINLYNYRSRRGVCQFLAEMATRGRNPPYSIGSVGWSQ